MKIFIKIKDNITISDLNNRFFSEFKKSQKLDGEPAYVRRIYKKDNFGIGFLEDNYKLDRSHDFVTHPHRYWREMLNSIQRRYSIWTQERILDEDQILKLFVTFADIDLQKFLEEWRMQHYNKEFEIKNDLDTAMSIYFPQIEGEDEFDWLLERKCFFFIDDQENLFIVLDGKFYLGVKSLYFTTKNGEVIISDEVPALKEYLSPIYKIKEGIYSFDTAIKPKEFLEALLQSSKLIFEPDIRVYKDEVKFHSPFLKKVNYDVSFEDFVNSLKFTEYANYVAIYETLNIMQEDSCREFDCKNKHKENDELFIGASKGIRYISDGLYTSEIVMKGGLFFHYVKKVDTLIIETLPQINGVYVLNETVLNIILKMLYNVTDLENIKEVFISNKLLGPVVISKSVLEKFPKLQESRHYQKSLQIIEQLHQIYSDETQRRKALDLERKRERRIMVTTINHNIDKFNEALSIRKNGGVAPHSVFVKTTKSGEDYVIIYHKLRTQHSKHKWHYRSTHIVEAPKIIDIIRDRIFLDGMIICFPEGTTEIRGLKARDGAIAFNLRCLYDMAKLGNYPEERQLFIILPSSLDLSKFEFFKHLDEEHLTFISDDMNFVEQFRQKRREYNRNCEIGMHFNVPIVCDPQIYEKIWGYRSNTKSLYMDLKDRIKLEQDRVKEERRKNEEYRFLQKKELAYVFDYDDERLTLEAIEVFFKDMSDEELKEFVSNRGLAYKLFYGKEAKRLRNFELAIYTKREIIKKAIQDIMLSDPDLVLAINYNDPSILTKQKILHSFNRFSIFFKKGSKNLRFRNLIFKAFLELVHAKTYYDIPVIQDVKKVHQTNLPSSFNGAGYAENAKKRTYYYMAEFIISSGLLVECLNYNVFEENFKEAADLINSYPEGWAPLYTILYMYQVLKESGLYFEVNKFLPHDLIDELVKMYPPVKERFEQIDEFIESCEKRI